MKIQKRRLCLERVYRSSEDQNTGKLGTNGSIKQTSQHFLKVNEDEKGNHFCNSHKSIAIMFKENESIIKSYYKNELVCAMDTLTQCIMTMFHANLYHEQ